MHHSRYLHTATLLPNGKVLVTGGYGDVGFTGPAELYDPTSGTWTLTGTNITARMAHTATLLPNGKVLVAGGTPGILSSAELYDPITGNWTATGSLNDKRRFHAATLLPNGKVLVTGGEGLNPDSTTTALSTAELYDPATGNWTLTGSLHNAREAHTATLHRQIVGRKLIASSRAARRGCTFFS